jgi:D-glycero-D-manno-heptose 1,7-bisphosphate phosphatase
MVTDSPPREAVLLDRDGVLNVDLGYTHRPEDLVFVSGAIEAVRRLNRAGRLVLVITNQAGVARGLYDEAAVVRFHIAINEALARHAAHVDAFYYCPYAADAIIQAYRHPNHPDRKPNPGMIQRALADFGVSPADALLIGDRPSDVEAARRAQVRGYLFKGGNLDVFLQSILAVRVRGRGPI